MFVDTHTRKILEKKERRPRAATTAVQPGLDDEPGWFGLRQKPKNKVDRISGQRKRKGRQRASRKIDCFGTCPDFKAGQTTFNTDRKRASGFLRLKTNVYFGW